MMDNTPIKNPINLVQSITKPCRIAKVTLTLITLEVVLPKLDKIKDVTWNYNVYYLQGNHKYYMILGRDILSDINIDFCFYDNKIMVNGGLYKVYTSPMKYISKMDFNASSD